MGFREILYLEEFAKNLSRKFKFYENLVRMCGGHCAARLAGAQLWRHLAQFFGTCELFQTASVGNQDTVIFFPPKLLLFM